MNSAIGKEIVMSISEGQIEYGGGNTGRALIHEEARRSAKFNVEADTWGDNRSRPFYAAAKMRAQLTVAADTWEREVYVKAIEVAAAIAPDAPGIELEGTRETIAWTMVRMLKDRLECTLSGEGSITKPGGGAGSNPMDLGYP